MEVEPSLFVDSDYDGDQSSSLFWQHVHFDPPPTTEVVDVGKMSNNLKCFSCEGLILQKRCCRARLCIGTSSVLINLGGGDGGAKVNQGLELALREVVAMLSVVLERTSLCWLEVTVSISIYSLVVLANKHLPKKYQTKSSAQIDARCYLGPVHMYSSPIGDATNLSPYRIRIHSSVFVIGCVFISPWFQIEPNFPHFICLCLLGSSHAHVKHWNMDIKPILQLTDG